MKTGPAPTSDIILGDCLDVLQAWPDSSIDAVVTDPPYGIGFMGKEWDTFKPGVAESRVIENTEAATSANPNVKGRTRRPASSPSAVEYDRTITGQHAFQVWTEAWAREAFRVLKPGGYALVFGAPRSFHRMACGLEDAGFEIRDTLMWMFGQGFPKSLDVSKAIDKAAGATRSAVGSKIGRPGYSLQQCDNPGGVAMEGNIDDGSLRNPQAECAIMAPETDDALTWDGWGTALKPAWEPIIMARKPLEGTVVQNVLAHGTGAINVDGCRIATDDAMSFSKAAPYTDKAGTQGRTWNPTSTPGMEREQSALGRWPANLLHDGSEDVLACFPDAPGQLARESTRCDTSKTRHVYAAMARGSRGHAPRAESQTSAARFFYQAKTSTGERNYGCDDLPAVSAGEMTGGRKEGSAGLQNPRAGAGRTGGGSNPHPTVKPIRLMRWLCRLVCRPGGLIIDPFLGSGTTGIAADLEGFSFVGIEQDPAWVRLAETRIAAWMVRPDGEEVTRP